MILRTSFFYIVLLIYSCKAKTIKNENIDNQYASLFELKYSDNTIRLYSKDGKSHIFYLHHIPKKIIITSSSHAGFINELRAKHLVIAVSNKKYFFDSFYQSSQIEEVGDMGSLNIEKIIRLKPDILILNPSSLPQKQFVALLERAGISCLFTEEYNESHPLGQAEWIRLFGMIVGREKLSDSIFNETAKEYKQIENIARNEKKIKVMTGFPWNGQWYMSGMNSLFAKMVAAAGGHYLVDSNIYENTPISTEQILKIGKQAAVWINISDVRTKEKIINGLSYHNYIQPLKTDNCYNNIKKQKVYGANDYWERGIARPDIILNDLHNILHIHSGDYYYYEKLN